MIILEAEERIMIEIIDKASGFRLFNKDVQEVCSEAFRLKWLINRLKRLSRIALKTLVHLAGLC